MFAILMMGFTLIVATAPQAEAQVYYEHSGLVTKTNGSPAPGVRMRCIASVGGMMESVTGDDGRFEFFVRQGATFQISWNDLYYPDHQYISIAPAVRYGTSWHGYIHHDFTVTPYPTVIGSVQDTYGEGFAVSDVEVVVNGQVVAVTNANGGYSFVAGSNFFGLPSAPLSGTIVYRKTFHTFSPGTSYYDVTDFHDETMPAVGMTLDDVGAAGVAITSWETEHGSGWDHFPHCPAEDFPNSPNIHADLSFQTGYVTSEVPTSRLRFVADPSGIIPAGGVQASDPIGGGHGSHTTFASPITQCGMAELRIDYAIDQADGSLQWYPLASMQSGSSNLDLYEDGTIDLIDLPPLAAARGSSVGDPNYDPCADFVTDGTINLADIGVFASHFGHSNAKSAQEVTDLADLAHVLGAVARQATDGIDVVLSFDLDRSWYTATIDLSAAAASADRAVWTPAARFGGAGIIADDGQGKTQLVLICDTPHGAGDVGIVTLLDCTDAGPADKLALHAMSVEGVVDQSDAAAELVSGSSIRMWAPRSVGQPGGDPFIIRFSLARDTTADVRIFDLKGRLIQDLMVGRAMQAGEHSVQWAGRDRDGRAAPAGVYFAQLRAGNEAVSQKLIVVH